MEKIYSRKRFVFRFGKGDYQKKYLKNTKKIKVCAKCHHEGTCLKGDKCDKCDCYLEDKRDDCDYKKDEHFLKEADFKDLNF